jgi:hypothetical protein
MEMIFGVVAFVLLFAAWVIVPTIVKKRHAMRAEEEGSEY